MWKRPDEPSPATGPSSSTAHPGPGPGPAPSPPHPPAARGEAASIGASITVKGDISGEEDLLVQGRVEGTIDLKTNHVTVGTHGRVKADIHGRVIDIQGEVEGNLFGDEQVVVRKSGAVRGNITAPRVSLEDGANFKGTIDMEPKPRPKEQPAGARPPERGASAGAAGPAGRSGGGNGKSAEREPEAAQAGAQASLPGSSGTAKAGGAGSARG